METATATYVKLPGGKWGIRARQKFEVGASVLVKVKGGGGRRVVVAGEVFDEHYVPGVHLYAVKEEPRKQAGREAKCRYAGTAECCGCPHCKYKSVHHRDTENTEKAQRKEAGSGEITKEEAALEMERAKSCQELFQWLTRNQGRFGAEKKEILGWFNMRMRKLKVEATDRFRNRERRSPQRHGAHGETQREGAL
jgi:hypothetical protein